MRIGRGGFYAASALLLAACQQQKETGPDVAASDAGIPDVAAPLVAPSMPSATENPGAARPLASFAGKDSDADGQITAGEYAQAAQLMFRMMDADRNGTVTLAEHAAARTAMGEAQGVVSEQVIAANDSDGDRKLTLSEWVAGTNAHFDALDTTGDGAIDSREWGARDHRAQSPITTPRTGPH